MTARGIWERLIDLYDEPLFGLPVTILAVAVMLGLVVLVAAPVIRFFRWWFVYWGVQ